MPDLLSDIPFLDCTQPARACHKCSTTIPDDLLSCPKCAIEALPAPGEREKLLLRYETARKAAQAANERLAKIKRELAVNCQHEVADPEGSICLLCGLSLTSLESLGNGVPVYMAQAFGEAAMAAERAEA